MLGLSVRERRSPGFALTLIGVIFQLASVILTARFELPINARVMTWSPENLPEGWEGVRERWETVHTVRTAISVVGLGCLVAAALTSLERSDSDRVWAAAILGDSTARSV